MIEIISYQDKYQPDFKRLNLEWLDKYNLTEDYDLKILDNPKETVIEKGGVIFLAVDSGKIVGTAGLTKNGDLEYELIKMAVDTEQRGKGIGKSLLKYCIDVAKDAGAEKISLFSSSHLKTALKMYEQFGFNYVEVTDSPMLTADVKMELSL